MTCCRLVEWHGFWDQSTPSGWSRSNPFEGEINNSFRGLRRKVDDFNITKVIWMRIKNEVRIRLASDEISPGALALGSARKDSATTLVSTVLSLATIVFRDSCADSTSAGLERLIATCASFALCLLYLSLFPFQPLGMAALIGLGTVVMMLLGRREDIVTTGITTAVVMVVAAISPQDAWQQPLLRLVDTIVGVATGRRVRPRCRSCEDGQALRSRELGFVIAAIQTQLRT